MTALICDSATDKVLFNQYADIYKSINESHGIAEDLRKRIVKNATEIRELHNKEMLGLVANNDGQVPNTKWPAYAIAFVVMCVSFAIMTIVVAVKIVRKIGMSAKTVVGAIGGSFLAIAIFLTLVQRLA